MKQSRERQKADKEKIPTSKITVFCNDEKVTVDYDLKNDFDLARAAWALIKACENKGQKDNLMRILKEERGE